jgi:hypothetical protein
VGTERLTPEQVSDYCRQIETYLCRKNDGHLIRVVGPSFERVSDWARKGVPLKVAFAGIDRYFERYYRKGGRRRPVKIDFCQADVLDTFDEWRRATGIVLDLSSSEGSGDLILESLPCSAATLKDGPAIASRSLPAHLERVVLRLSSARGRGTLGETFDDLIDQVSSELDRAASAATGLRGPSRQALIDRLAVLDAELLRRAGAMLNDAERSTLEREAAEELGPFRGAMTDEAFAAACERSMARLVRQRFGLPTISFG